MASFIVQLNDLKLYGYHGVHPEEALVGGWFGLNLRLHIKAPGGEISLENTVNYAEVYATLKGVFADRKPLLEEVAVAISGALHQQFPRLRKIRIELTKLHPPIAGMQGKVGVAYKKKFKQ